MVENDNSVTQVSEEFVESEGITLHVASAGSGPTVILLHGFPDSSMLWRRQIRALSQAGFRVLAPDLRGFGQSSRPADPSSYGMNALTGDVLTVMDYFGVGSASVVGHDWGAVLAWQLAMAAPDRGDRLAVISVGHPAAGPAAGPEQRQLSWYMLWFLFPGVAEKVLPERDWKLFREWGWNGSQPGEDPDCDRQIADLSRPGALTAALNWYRANIRPERYFVADDGRPPRASITCATMGIWSTGDRFLNEAQMTGSRRYVSGPWRYERLSGDHWVPAHASDELNRLLLDFLGAAARPATATPPTGGTVR